MKLRNDGAARPSKIATTAMTMISSTAVKPRAWRQRDAAPVLVT